MKNALILHGTDFGNDQKQRLNNWFPWLKEKLEQDGYEVWLPELPEAYHPDITRYWDFLKNFNFNEETVLIGHSSGGATVLGILNKLPKHQKVRLAISVAGFYKDEGWDCEGLFSETFDWEKIRTQAKNIVLYWSPDDPYISKEQTDYLATKLNVAPTIIDHQKHFSVGTVGTKYKEFPELLNQIING